MRWTTLVVLLAVASAGAETFEIDTGHSSVSFSIRHIVSKTTGRFTKFSGTAEYVAGKPEKWKITVEIDPASIDTDSARRDGHLRGPDFFDVEKCPEMSFRSTKVKPGKKGKPHKLHGDLTMHCVTKPVILDLEFHGIADTRKKRVAGATATGTLNRKDWDIIWNRVLDTGGVMIGEEVKITIEIEAAAKK